MPTAEVFPLATIGPAGSYPEWIRGLRHASGVYIIRELKDDAIAYVGESHSGRLYSTLTRHFQAWTNDYNTAGATFDRGDVQVAVIVVPAKHAQFLQNELICALDPTENRMKCDQLFESYDEDEEPGEEWVVENTPPPGYDYDIQRLLKAIAYEWESREPEHYENHNDDQDVPF